MHTAGKVWGKTANIFSNPNFEVHRIEVNKGGYCSKHKHKYKFNAFYVESGELDIIIYKNDYDLVDTTTLKAGDMTIAKSGEYHHNDIERESVGGV